MSVGGVTGGGGNTTAAGFGGALLHGEGVATGAGLAATAGATTGTLAAVGAALRGRGESALAALVPPESESPELDAAIDALKNLF